MKEMKREGNNNWLVIIVTAIITLIIAIALIYFLFIKKPEEGGVSNNQTNNQQVNDNTNNNQTDNDVNNEYSEWMRYILRQNITDIKLVRVRLVSNDDGQDIDTKEINLNIEKLREIFKNILSNNKNIQKQLIGPIDFGNMEEDYLRISYYKNNKTFEIIINENRISFDLVDNDSDFILALNNSNIIEIKKDESCHDYDKCSYHYSFKNSITFDKYFN